MMMMLLLLLLFCSLCFEWGHSVGFVEVSGVYPYSAAYEPYPALNGGAFSAPTVAVSPDPLVNYRWNLGSVNQSLLQSYTYAPVSVDVSPSSSSLSFEFASSSLRAEGAEGAEPPMFPIIVRGAGRLRLDWGRENAAWLELITDLPPANASRQLRLGVGEFNDVEFVNPGPSHSLKAATPVFKGDGVYRLELNSELYEGVRFGFVDVLAFDEPFVINGVRLVCQTKPVNYVGSFNVSDASFNTIWYAAAYTVKLNLLSTYFGAVLEDRGDRFSWTGDAHVAQAVSMVAFANYDFVESNLLQTANDTNGGIESYSLYWVLSACDYVSMRGVASVSPATLKTIVGVIDFKLAHAIAIWGSSPSLNFYGGDERLGSYFEAPSGPEPQRCFALLTIRTLREAHALYTALHRPSMYNATADRLTALLPATFGYPTTLGMHAAAEAFAAGVVTSSSDRALLLSLFDNAVTLPSFAPFNAYFVLRGLSAARRDDIGVALVDLVWGGQLALGATTFWEVYSPQWNNVIAPNDPIPSGTSGATSLCHPWSSGVARWLVSSFAGLDVELEQPSATRVHRRVTFSPSAMFHADSIRFWSLDVSLPVGGSRTSTTTPTSASDTLVVRVNVDLRSGLGVVHVPVGLTLSFAVPHSGRVVELVVDGEHVPSHAVVRDDSHVRLVSPLVGADRPYAVRLLYKQQRSALAPIPTVPKLPFRYAAKFVGFDLQTAGSWIGHYGSVAYSLFNYDGPGLFLTSSPASETGLGVGVGSGAVSMSVVCKNDVGWDSPANITLPATTPTPVGYLQDPRQPSRRALGAVITQPEYPPNWSDTFRIDVLIGFANASAARPLRLTVYMANPAQNTHKQMLYVMDYATMNVAAPYQLVDGAWYTGVYATFIVTGSVRLRLCDVGGEISGGSSAVSAVFLDEL